LAVVVDFLLFLDSAAGIELSNFRDKFFKEIGLLKYEENALMQQRKRILGEKRKHGGHWRNHRKDSGEEGDDDDGAGEYAGDEDGLLADEDEQQLRDAELELDLS
jgi:hypothetical protein